MLASISVSGRTQSSSTFSFICKQNASYAPKLFRAHCICLSPLIHRVETAETPVLAESRRFQAILWRNCFNAPAKRGYPYLGIPLVSWFLLAASRFARADTPLPWRATVIQLVQFLSVLPYIAEFVRDTEMKCFASPSRQLRNYGLFFQSEDTYLTYTHIDPRWYTWSSVSVFYDYPRWSALIRIGTDFPIPLKIPEIRCSRQQVNKKAGKHHYQGIPHCRPAFRRIKVLWGTYRLVLLINVRTALGVWSGLAVMRVMQFSFAIVHESALMSNGSF
jgi:hypothetical protein